MEQVNEVKNIFKASDEKEFKNNFTLLFARAINRSEKNKYLDKEKV